MLKLIAALIFTSLSIVAVCGLISLVEPLNNAATQSPMTWGQSTAVSALTFHCMIAVLFGFVLCMHAAMIRD